MRVVEQVDDLLDKPPRSRTVVDVKLGEARMDGQPDLESTPKPQLVYPFEGPPARGRTTEVAPGVHWIRMPLPYALNHINLWALDDGDGWALVDTGVRNEETGLVWREQFANAPDDRSITRIFVTHMHPAMWAWRAG